MTKTTLLEPRLWLLTIVFALVTPSVPAYAQLGDLKMIDSGTTHTCSLTNAGGVKCWGSNSLGQLGDGTQTTRYAAVAVTGLDTGVEVVAAGGSHTCAVTTSGGVKCWGYNLYGQLGDSSNTLRNIPVDTTGLTYGVATVTSGNKHSCALTTSHGAKCWGDNDYGKLGDNTSTDRNFAMDVNGLSSGVHDIDAGKDHTCALTEVGGVMCWGRNNSGQLGDNSTTNRLTAVNVTGLLSGISAISTFENHTCALTTAGGVKCWGENNNGELGDGTSVDRLSAVSVSGLTTGVSDISTGATHTCALTTSGSIKCWGLNFYGQLGDMTTIAQTVPVNVSNLSSGITGLSAGGTHTCAITSSGNARCWGNATSGQLGNGDSGLRTSAVNAIGLSAGSTRLAVGSYSGCVITSNHGIKCWGDNNSGQLGNGTVGNGTLAGDVIGLSSGALSVTTRLYHTCAITSAGGVKCWGYNFYGELGDGTDFDRFTPVDVSGMTTGVIAVSNGNLHSCAITTTGGVKCWGLNNNKQLGDGTTVNRWTATDVSGLASNIERISAGSSHSCVITSTGSVKCWGYNLYGQLGDGTTTNASVPVDTAILTSGAVAISAGDLHTCAITSIGGARCWGRNTNGQLGDNTTTNRTTPSDVNELTTGVLAISAGDRHTCAITSTGEVKCWGDNSNGQLGDGTVTNRRTPITAHGLSPNPIAIGTGANHTCILTALGEVQCWGRRDEWQLGDGPLPISTVLKDFTLQGTITSSGSPLAGVVLRPSNLAAAQIASNSSSDISGTYLLPLVESTSFTVTPELAGYTFSPPSITGTMSSNLTQDFVATLITYNITGTVTAGGNPLAGATVDGGALGTRTTDASGNYAFNTITPATVYTLTVSHSGATFGVDTASGTLNNHATHDFSGTLNTYNIVGTITAGGNPLSGVTISGGALGDTIPDGSGSYSFAGVVYGTAYSITPSLSDYDFSPASASGTLADNITADFTGVYDPPSTTTSTPSTSSGLTTSTSSGLTTSTSSIATTTSAATTTVISTTTVEDDPTPTSTTSTLISSTTSPTTSVSTSTTVLSTSSTPTTSSAPAEDSDNDGISDDDEQANGTDPDKPDTDDDGITDAEELTAGTNPKDPGSKAPKLRTTICSEWNGYLGGQNGSAMNNIMEHINLTTKKLRVKTELRSIRGHLKDTYEFFLRGNQQFDLLVHDLSGREANSYGQICTTYKGAPVGSLDGRMVYYKLANDGGIQFAFALPFENPMLGGSALLFNTQQPSLDPHDSENFVANWVQLSNVSPKRLKGKLYFHALDGSILGTYSVNLRDGARYDYSAHAWGRSAGLVRFAPQDNTVEYQLRGIRYLYDNPGATDSFASAYPFAATVGSGETLIAPVDAGTDSAVLELANTLAKKVSVSVALYDQTGKKRLYSKNHVLKAYSSEHLQLSPLLANSTGLLTAKSSLAGSIIGSVVHYGRTSSQGVQNMYAIPLHEPILPILRGSYNTYLNQGCTLYLGNASASNEKVSISMRQNDGTKPVKDYSKTVPGRGVIAEDICSKSPHNVYGVVTVTASQPKRIYGVVVRNGEGGRYKMATELR